MATQFEDDDFDSFCADFGIDKDIHIDTSKPTAPLYTVPIAKPYSEPCKSCNATGQFRGYSGRVVGTCFKCKGTGELVFKTSPEQRSKSRQYAQKTKDARQQTVTEAAQQAIVMSVCEYLSGV